MDFFWKHFLLSGVAFIKLDLSKIADNDFIFNFLGILLGFSLTIFTFIVSLVEKIKEKGEMKFQNDNNKLKKLQSVIDDLYVEIKDDIYFTFLSLIIIALAYLLETSIGDLDLKYFVINKTGLFNSIRLSVFLLNLYAIYDLIIVSFQLSDTVGILKKAED
ncbi:hypothetical protein [Pedobacter zeae]|uniref:Uncharacterized protein n=1 Tax=Pedobacter zeae TaxID=1737356 RepID=A0A7W6KD98_9SPHI|nr:hypothetical protein [Pedobacter zeae]MBB4108620.1 hypothetical protein [Pedobacter zeae]GGG91597.1 hypothetical protein GCM10007422_00650 [Pedobacter zeae]